MIEFIIGDYEFQDVDILLKEFSPSAFQLTEFNKDSTFILFADDISLTKEQIDWIKENAKNNVKLIFNDKSQLKNFRASKTYKLNDTRTEKGEINPFELSTALFNSSDREYLLQFLIQNKVNLFVIMKHLSAHVRKFSETNQKNLQFVDKYMWKCTPEIIYHFIAKFFRPEPWITFLKWKYPKKEEKA